MNQYMCKAKRRDNGKWVCGYYVMKEDVIFKTKNHFILIQPEGESFASWYPVDPDTVCRCTGWADKNGKWIFEGDIFVYSSEYSYVVKWDSKKIGFCAESMNSTYDYDYLNNFYDILCEVVGNIFDNTELMEE